MCEGDAAAHEDPLRMSLQDVGRLQCAELSRVGFSECDRRSKSARTLHVTMIPRPALWPNG